MDQTENEPTTQDTESPDTEAHAIRRGPEDAEGIRSLQDAQDEPDVEAHRVPRGT
jgi:hypothetical protein